MQAVDKLLREPPAAMKRLGKKLFLPVPLYRAKKKYKPVYINVELFNLLFKPKKKMTFDEMSKVIAGHFNVTIEAEKGEGKPLGIAYVDRQSDPLDVSLAGNLGSGRAYYTGKYFNIKGERTPLATSEKRRFSDGLLEMERCIWEALVANGLQGSLGNGLTGVLAVLDMDETCKVVWRDKAVRRGKIIRVDMDGALDRITHLFYNKKPLGKAAFERMARNFGTLEGDKFIERIVHGAWSPGNITPGGHLVDFDTVAATRGRSPQYSSTQWHFENYFGYEHFGQANILKALTEDGAINKSKVSAEHLRGILFDTRLARIRARLPYLMGFADDARVYKKYRKQIDALCELWMPLAQKSYLRQKNLSTKMTACVSLPVFDFSAFFRLYPLQKRLGVFSPVDALETLCAHAPKNAFAKDKGEKLKPVAQQYRDAVMAQIGGDFVTSRADLNMLKIAALQFVKSYDRLHAQITKEMRIPLARTEANAYIVNEDRFFLFPAYTKSYDFAERIKLPPRQMNGVIGALIAGTRRIADAKIADVRLHKTHMSCVLLDGKGEHRRLRIPYDSKKTNKNNEIIKTRPNAEFLLTSIKYY